MLPIRLVMRFAPEARLRVEDEFEGAGMELRDDGFMDVFVTWPEDEWVYRTILSYGEHVEVIEPPHIRRMMQKKAERMMAFYQT